MIQRRTIRERVTRGEATVNELVAPFELGQPAISKHLNVAGREHGSMLLCVWFGEYAELRVVELLPWPIELACV